jgi:hypothetical protein
MNIPIMNEKITRWLLLLWEFNITILDMPGRETLVASWLSHINNPSESIHVVDTFSDEK